MEGKEKEEKEEEEKEEKSNFQKHRVKLVLKNPKNRTFEKGELYSRVGLYTSRYGTNL